jgi:hypothetical protein
MLWLTALLNWWRERRQRYCHCKAVAVRRNPETGDWSSIDRYGSPLATALYDEPYHLDHFGFLVSQEPGDVAVQLWGVRKIWRARSRQSGIRRLNTSGPAAGWPFQSTGSTSQYSAGAQPKVPDLRPMISDPDIFHAAKLVIDQRGEEAATFAAGRADELLEDGDIDGALVWRRILAAIEELQRGPREDEAVN